MRHTVEEIRLKNGARGLFIDVPGATVMSSQFQFRAGNRYARDKTIEQVAHIMEHMAFGANARFKDEHAFEADFTKNGAYHNAYTTDINMVYVADCADFEWDRILELQQVAITQPKFNNEELESEKGNVKSELTGYLNNHNRLLWPKMQQMLGEDVLTFRQRLGTIADVDLNDIREHHRRTHTAENMRFVIAGKLTGRKSALIRMLESWELERGERFVVPADVHKSAKPALIKRQESPNLTFGVSLVIDRKLSDYEADVMHFLNHILTGTTYSRIYGAARKKGLAYGVFSDSTLNERDSSWDFGGQVNLETAEALFDIIVRELKNTLKGDIAEEEIEAAKQYTLGRYQMGAQTVAQISNFYAGRYFSDDFVRDYEAFPSEITKVKAKDIVGLANEFMTTDAWALAGVGSAQKEQINTLHEKFSSIFEQSK